MASIKDALVQKGRSRREALAGGHGRGLTAAPRRNDLLPPLHLLSKPIGELRSSARKLRRVEPDHVREAAASISGLGFCIPIVIDADNKIVDGEVRLEAARHLGLTHVPCLLVGHLSPTELRLLRLAINRLQERGTWNLDELKLEFSELIVEEAPIELSGFTSTEIDQIVLDDDAAAPEQGPLEPDESEPRAKPGDMFILGDHRVICGDARDPEVLKRLMEGDTTPFVFTDQPYNVPIGGHVTSGEHREFAMASGEMSPEEFEAFTAAWMAAALPYLRDGGLLATYIDWRGLATVHAAASGLDLHQLNLIVWAKTGAGMGSLYRSQHELLPLYKNGVVRHTNNIELGRHGRWRSNLWTYPGAASLGSEAREGLKDHPTVKPTAMLEDALIDLTDRGDIVLDPFAGSGSTLIAAERTGRRCRCVELDPAYVEVILRRYECFANAPVCEI